MRALLSRVMTGLLAGSLLCKGASASSGDTVCPDSVEFQAQALQLPHITGTNPKFLGKKTGELVRRELRATRPIAAQLMPEKLSPYPFGEPQRYQESPPSIADAVRYESHFVQSDGRIEVHAWVIRLDPELLQLHVVTHPTPLDKRGGKWTREELIPMTPVKVGTDSRWTARFHRAPGLFEFVIRITRPQVPQSRPVDLHRDGRDQNWEVFVPEPELRQHFVPRRPVFNGALDPARYFARRSA
jgi:hypothetical protein